MKCGNIIFLNGTACSGKTTLAKKLQEKLVDHYFHLSIDDFCGMAPSNAFEHDLWKLTHKCFNGLHNTINLYSNLGYNVIAVEIFMEIDSDWEVILPECLELLHDKPVLFVRLDCPLDELEKREINRGDIELGVARQEYDEVHKNHLYDLTVNTYENSPDECAYLIIDKLKHINECNAFKLMYQKMNVKG